MSKEQNIFELLHGDCAKADIDCIKSKLTSVLVRKLNSVTNGKPTEIALLLGCSKSEASRLRTCQTDSMSIEKLIKHLRTVNIKTVSSFVVKDGDLLGFEIHSKIV